MFDSWHLCFVLQIKCYWPPKSGKPATYQIVHNAIPDKELWEVYKVRIIGKGKFKTLKKLLSEVLSVSIFIKQ